jgi:hypothetical protein
VVASLARSVGVIALLLPIALSAAWSAHARRDRALAGAIALAIAACTLVIVGLVLSSFSGVSLAGWLGALAVVDLLLLARAARRSGRGFSLLRRPARARVRVRSPRLLPTLLGTAALAIVVVAVLLSAASARRQERQSHFTQLWMLATTRAGQPAAEIGVTNVEAGTTSYQLVVASGGRVLLSGPLRLAVSGVWSTVVSLSPTPQRQLVTATLYRAADPTAYRVTNLWTPAP